LVLSTFHIGRPDGRSIDLLLSPTQRSLLAAFELQAHLDNTSLQMTLIGPASEPIGTSYIYERRVRGRRTGIYDGTVFLSPTTSSAQERFRLHALVPALREADVVTLRIIGTRFPSAASIVQPRAEETLAKNKTIQEVIPLAGTYESFLRTLGKHTRRNIVHGRNKVERDSMRFSFLLSASSLDDSTLSEIALRNIHFRVCPRRILNIIDFLKAQPCPFQASLSQSRGNPFSVTGGFIRGDMALMNYQINDRAFYTLSPSLMLRSFLVEELIKHGVRYLAFVGGCGGLLFHQCTPEIVSETLQLLVRRKFVARAKHAYLRIARPMSRFARLVPQFI
jgi:hypothetical protein